MTRPAPAVPAPDVPARAVFVGAQPDDVDFGAGGLLALWSRAGCEVTVVCVTDGDSGGFDDDVPRQQVPELRRDLARVLRQVRPEAVVAHCPERDYRFVFLHHPDHLATGAAVLAAVYPDARNAYAFPELRTDGLEPWAVSAVWLYGSPADEVTVDVTDVFDDKVRACSAHSSQSPMLGRGVEDELRDWLGRRARERGLPAGRYAETYQVLDTA